MDDIQTPVRENRIVEIFQDNSLSKPVVLNLHSPLSSFFTSSIRGGSKPSDIIDVLGDDGTHTMRYVRIRIVKY